MTFLAVMRWVALTGLALASVPASAQAAPADLAATIGRYATDQSFSGTILVEARGKRLYTHSFGMADRAFDVPASDDTRYRVASITKLFTSVLILQLVEQGRIDLAAPIARYLPDYPGEGADTVTIRQLLDHTSGIVQFDRIDSYQRAFAEGMPQYQRPMRVVELLRTCCAGKLAAPPGTAFDYNNADYIVLGAIIERLTGQSYEAALRDRILSPLALADTGMAHWDAIVPRLAPTYFYRDDGKTLIPDMPVYFENWFAAGALYSSANDLAHFADALFGGRLLKPATLETLLTPGLDDYGLGLWSYTIRRGGRDYHVAKRPGRIMGANAVLYRLRERDLTIILLANTNLVDLDVFAQRIANAFVGEPAAKK